MSNSIKVNINFVEICNLYELCKQHIAENDKKNPSDFLNSPGVDLIFERSSTGLVSITASLPIILNGDYGRFCVDITDEEKYM